MRQKLEQGESQFVCELDDALLNNQTTDQAVFAPKIYTIKAKNVENLNIMKNNTSTVKDSVKSNYTGKTSGSEQSIAKRRSKTLLAPEIAQLVRKEEKKQPAQATAAASVKK